MTKFINKTGNNEEEDEEITIFENVVYNNELRKAYTNPSAYEIIELICLDYRCEGFDLMFAFNKDRQMGYLYLGKWNGGKE